MAEPQGALVLCPTPLGNLDDLTLRTLAALRACDVIFAEDTRVSAKLFAHFGIAKPVRSYHERVERRRVREALELLADGKTVAVVTDAGMPGISDPGVELVRAARDAGARVEVLPGPSAVLGALVLSGFDATRFRFDGFPPRKPGARRAYLESLRAERAPVVWFEAPTRVLALLADVHAIAPQRLVFALREYTKKFEQHALGTARDVAAQIGDAPRGEFTLVLDGAPEAARASAAHDGVAEAAELLAAHGVSARDIAAALRSATGIPKNELYRLAAAARRRR